MYRIYVYMLFTASLGLPLAHIELFSIDIYMLSTASLGSAFSTYSVLHTHLWVHALYSLLGLSLAHTFYTMLYASFEVSRAH